MKKFLFLIFFFFTTNVFTQVNADFIMSPPNGCSPLAVNFTDQSTGGATSWNWTFGNGNASSQQNPGAVYITPGNYAVCLTASDGIISDTFCDTVIVFDNPQVNFVADDSVGCSNLNVNFTNLTITGTGIQSALWNFGDGNTDNNINPSHTFAPGIYDITLIVTDSSGCIGQGDKQQYINSITAPNPNFTATNTQSCSIPTVVNFTNTSTNDAGATYTWDFGDGSPTSNIENPTHAYTAFGDYDVQLIVTKNGCIDSITIANLVNIQAQDADFNFSATNICVGQSVNFTDQSVLTPTGWSWDFGDGSAVSTAQNPSHTYNTAGVYTVSLSTTLTGCDDIETKVNLITVNDNPTVNFNANITDTCSSPFEVDFTSMASPGVTYNWSFGDGGTDAAANPTHIYNSAGSFSVLLSVTDANNCSASSSQPGLINITPPVANFDIDSVFGCAPRTINITDLSTSDNTITDWFWDFGDGNTQNGPQNPTHVYIDTGSFEITLAITDSDGCVDTLQPGMIVNVGEPLMPDFTATPLGGCKLDPVSFTNLTDTLGIFGVQWLWDFGDGGTDNTFEPMYEYGDTGTFEVSLTVSHNGCASSISYPDLITINPPIALFTTVANCDNYNEVSFIDNSIDPETWTWDIAGDTFNTQDVQNYNTVGMPSPLPITLYVENLTFGCLDSLAMDFTIEEPVIEFNADDSLGCAPFNVQFNNNSTLGDTYQWDFGDGSMGSTAANPSHTYNNYGIYTVQLIVFNTLGCSDTLTYQNLITVIGSDPEFTSPDTAGCRVFTTNFQDLSSSVAGPITNWSWNFGDGSPLDTNQNPTHSFSEVGSFNISLTTTDSAGCLNTVTKPLYITSTGPLPSFTNTALSCVNSDINFTNTSSSLGGNIISYLWNFGDGNTSVLENPVHSYNNPGSYDISLLITDDNGCDSTLVVQNAITIDSLIVDFAADSTVGSCTGFIVNFEEMVSPSPISWEWDFGDGTGSSIPNPSTVYNNVGSFDVTLIASNSAGCLDTLVKQDFIVVNGPEGILSVSVDSGCIDLDVEFTILSPNSVNQTWDLGDGTVVSNNNLVFNHTYTDVNTFFPLVILADSAGCLIPYYFDTIYTGSINAEMYVDTNYICTPNTIVFADSSNSNPAVTSWNWNFGDGTISNIQNPSHTYTQDGVFDLSLIVNNGICADTANLPQYIVSDSSTNALFNFTLPSIVCPPVAITFGDLSSADSLITSYNWSFGNGDVSAAQNPGSIIYNSSGLYTVSLDIVTEKGCVSSFSDTLRVNLIPEFDFDLDSIILCINDDTTLAPLEPSANFTWTPSSNLSCSDCPDPTIFGNNSTTYFVNAVNNFGCEYDDTLVLQVSQLPEITINENQQVLVGSNVNLSAFSPGINSFNWSPSENLSCNNCENPEFTANETTLLIASIEDDLGCRNSDSTLVEVFEVCDGSFLLFPNVFTPNDDGKNDIFKPTRRQNLEAEINYFRIFDRWGNLVFETLDITEGWNGNSKNGNYLNNGVYIYTVDIICPDGSSQIYKGNITLLR